MKSIGLMSKTEVARLNNALKVIKGFDFPTTEEQENALIMTEEAMRERGIVEPRIKVGYLIEKYRRITHTDLLQKAWRYCSALELEPIVEELKDVGVIEEINKGRKRIYVWKEDISEGISHNT